MTIGRTLLLGGVLIAVGASVMVVGSTPRRQRPNVVLIVIDNAHFVDVHHPYRRRNPYRENYGAECRGFVDGKQPLDSIKAKLGRDEADQATREQLRALGYEY